VVRVEKSGLTPVLADQFDGKRLNSPNDLVYPRNRTLFFTDPPFGLPKHHDDPRPETPHSGVFLVRGGKVQLVSTDFTGPNGLAYSPDVKFLYVGNWDEKKVVNRYPVNTDGTLDRGELFFGVTSAFGDDAIDGLKVDQHGNVYVSGRRAVDSRRRGKASWHTSRLRASAQHGMGWRRRPHALSRRANRHLLHSSRRAGGGCVVDSLDSGRELTNANPGGDRLRLKRRRQSVKAPRMRGGIHHFCHMITFARRHAGQELPTWITQRIAELNRIGLVGTGVEFDADDLSVFVDLNDAELVCGILRVRS
jgi:hypothetical protein